MPTYLVTGASSGIGLELTKQLAARGDKVIATCRKKESSATGVNAIGEVSGDVTVLAGIDVANDGVMETLKTSLDSSTPIDVVVHNAGSLAGSRAAPGEGGSMADQKLDCVSMDTMRDAYEVNTLGPLRVQKALLEGGNMASPGKVAIISTGLGSITDNTSGGTYAYRSSKAAVNMIAKCMSCDLKAKEISVVAIAPGFVATEFGPGKEQMTKWGAMPVEKSVAGILTILDSMMTMENTGKFFIVKKDDDPKEMPW